jgi:bifunctional UDP-N-acetylglucosamine pyrophosphorylase/glucosamine-1-phosphate N-acetyltransferase
MKIVFLCGGIGKRMFPLTEDKFLFKFLGKTLLEHQIDIALKAGLKEFVIIGNEFNINKIKEICSQTDANVEFVLQEEANGMADALISGKKFLINDEILIVNPNDVFDISAYKKIIKARKENYDSYMIGHEVNSYFPGGYIEVNEKHELIRIHEKPGEGNEPSNLINIVIHLHKNPMNLFNYLEKTKSDQDDIYEKAISNMVDDGHKIKVISYDGFWHAIKYPWDIFGIVKYFLNNIKKPKISSKARISKKGRIYGNVIIEDNVRVLENAVIRGPCYIGKNTVVGNNVLIWNNTHIGDNCVIGYSSEIKNSYIADNCWLHMSYIGDSIIADNCSFGAGTITANFRFDEQPVKVDIHGKKNDSRLDKLGVIMGANCKTGINSCTMPGIRVGPNSIIGPGVTLLENLEPNKIILVDKKSYSIKENKITLSIEKKDELMKKLLKHGYDKK